MYKLVWGVGGRLLVTFLTCTGVVVRLNGISTGVVRTPFTKGYRGPSKGLPGVVTPQGGLRFDHCHALPGIAHQMRGDGK
jgi:hypothetical protein